MPYEVSGKGFTAVAVNCAAIAGEWVKSKLGGYADLQIKQSASDLVTEVDRGAERMVSNLIRTHFPHHAFLGEEGVEPGSQSSVQALGRVNDKEYVWIVDPIDGTTNFVHGFPFFCISIALAKRGEVAVGVIYDPLRDELFVAEKGKGAYLKGKPLRVSQERRLSDSLIATGFPADRGDHLARNMQGINKLAPQVRNIRVCGSAALHLAYVAAGRLSGFWEIGLNAWDLAAGALLVREAGGTISGLTGEPYQLEVRNVAASNGHIHRELLERLNGD